MIFEFISTTIVLILTLVVLFIVRYSIFIYSERKKYAHIPGTNPSGILGFFLGDIPTIIKHDRNDGIPFFEYLASLLV